MGYQKMIKLLDNTPNQPTKFRTKFVQLYMECTTLVVKLNSKRQY